MVRAKFVITSVELFNTPPGTGIVKMCAVYKSMAGVSGNACEENKIFGQYTPSASLSMNIQNPAAFDQFRKAFEANKPFYVDFSEAPE